MFLEVGAAVLAVQIAAPATVCEIGAAPPSRVQGFAPARLVIGDQGDSQLYRVQSATLAADLSVAVANGGTSEIHVFGPDGSLRSRLGGGGGGPHEFGLLGSASWMPGDRIAASDIRGQKVVVMDREKGFLAAIPIRDLTPWRLQSIWPLPDGRWLVASTAPAGPSSGGVRFRTQLAVTLHAANGDLEDRLLTFPGMDLWAYLDPQGGGSRGVPLFPKVTRISVDRTGCVWVNTGAALEVTRYDLEGRVRGTVALPKELGRPVTRDEWSTRLEAHVDRTLDPVWRPRVRRVFEAIPFDPVRPAMSGMKVDDQGRLWITPDRGPDEDIEGWWVYSGTEVEPTWIAAPPRTRRLLEIRYGHVVMLHVDDLGVETVSVREMLTGRAPRR